MGTYNVLRAKMECPRCGTMGEFEIDLYFGFRNLMNYEIGDVYRWSKLNSLQNGGRPLGGNLDGEGYTECNNCKKDFFVVVEVRGDRIVHAEPDCSKKPYIPDL